MLITKSNLPVLLLINKRRLFSPLQYDYKRQLMGYNKTQNKTLTSNVSCCCIYPESKGI